MAIVFVCVTVFLVGFRMLAILSFPTLAGGAWLIVRNHPKMLMEETLGNLSAFYAMFPGNQKFNVFPMWLSEDHHARLFSVFAPQIGHPPSEDLDSEYLNIFETRTRTPFFQEVYVDGVRVMLIIGPTGTGKSVHGNQIISLEQKYGGFAYIFDIGGSYESVVELYGGKVDRVGKDGRASIRSRWSLPKATSSFCTRL